MYKSILNYKIFKKIGAGTFSEVYLSKKDGENFALKIMVPPKGLSSEQLLQSLRYEFWVLKDLIHPHVVRVFDFGKLSDGRLFLVEEFLKGQSLDRFCEGKKFKDCEAVFLQVLQGLEAIHHWKMIHGDIKPENIFVVKNKTGFQAKILDFGLARPIEAKTIEPKNLSGTPATMAPEIILRQKPEARSDLYSLGVVFYQCLSGSNPFLGKNLETTLSQHLHYQAKPIGMTRDDVPPVWNEVLQKLLVKNPSARFASATQVLQSLRGSAFFLMPSAFVGREESFACLEKIFSALDNEKKLALIVSGEAGVGASHFLKEVFYRVLAKRPEDREKIVLGDKDILSTTLILFLERQSPPPGFAICEVILKPLTESDLSQWLQKLFHLPEIPASFLHNMQTLTQGLPKFVWDALIYLQDRQLLADSLGNVTRSSLGRIDWQEVFSLDEKKPLVKNFSYLLHEVSCRVKTRRIAEDDPLWEQLEGVIADTKDKTEHLNRRAQMLTLKGAALIDGNRFVEAREFLKTALEILSADPQYEVETLKIKNYLAYIALWEGRHEEAIQSYETVAETIERWPEEKKREIKNTDLGLAYLQAGRFQEAYDRLKQEVKLYENLALISQQMYALYNFARAAAALQKWSEATKAYEEVMGLAKEQQNLSYLTRSFIELGNAYQVQKKNREAIFAFGEALEIALAAHDFISAVTAAQNRGVVQSEEGHFEEARADLENSLQLAGQLKQNPYEKTLVCRSKLELGKVCQKLGEAELARLHLEKAWNLAENDKDLSDYRFWVLEARVELWIHLQDEIHFEKDFSQLNYYADDEPKKKIVGELKINHEKMKTEKPSERELQLEKELQTILHINQELVGDVGLEDLLKKILSYAIELTKAELGVLLLKNEKGRLVPEMSLNADLDDDLNEISTSVAQRVLQTGKVIHAADAGQDQNLNQYASVMNLHLKSILGAPIRFKGEVLGVFYLSHRYQIGLFDDRTVRVIATYADQVGLALKNHQLLQFYKRVNEDLQDELEVTHLNLTQAQAELSSRTRVFQRDVGGKFLMTKSPELIDILNQLERAANSTLSIVLHGESGTGKEILARYLHESSKRKNKSFIAINCGALPQNLVESELFGHKRGAFTGADRDKIGLIEASSGGTLFLDEITDLPLESQVKLLRILQEREIVRVGETEPRPVDIRVVAASFKNLKEAVQAKRFREDLYFRLAGFEVTIPPLRDRKTDIPILAEQFLQFFVKEQNKEKPQRIDNALLKNFLSYPWPGNIRELQNMIEVGVSLCQSPTLKREHYPESILTKLLATTTLKKSDGSQTQEPAGWYDPRKTWKEHELLIFVSALHKFDFDATRAAENLGVGVATVYKKMRDHKIKDLKQEWDDKILPYEAGLTLNEIRSHVFKMAAKRHEGHPYHAAQELAVAPVTFYRWSGL